MSHREKKSALFYNGMNVTFSYLKTYLTTASCGVIYIIHFFGPLRSWYPSASCMNPAGHRGASRGQPPPACSPSQPSSIEEGPLTPANFGRKCLEFRFRFREWTVIFFFYLALQPIFISTSTRTVWW